MGVADIHEVDLDQLDFDWFNSPQLSSPFSLFVRLSVINHQNSQVEFAYVIIGDLDSSRIQIPSRAGLVFGVMMISWWLV